MEPKTNYTLVGLMVIILFSSLLSMGLWLSVGFGQKSYNTYLLYLHEAVTGLNAESAVKFNGVPIGFVQKIELNEKDPQEVKLTLKIEKGTPITTSTTATLVSQGITGTSFIGLAASSPSLSPLTKTEGHPYPIIPSRPSLYTQVDTVLREVAENINGVSNQLKKVFDAQNTAEFKKSLHNIEVISSSLANHSQKMGQAITNADKLFDNLAKASESMPQLIQDLKRVTQKMGETSENVSSTMTAGKSAINKFSQQTIPTATDLMRRLDDIAANLEKMSAQLRQNPSVIVRGSGAPTPGPGE